MLFKRFFWKKYSKGIDNKDLILESLALAYFFMGKLFLALEVAHGECVTKDLHESSCKILNGFSFLWKRYSMLEHLFIWKVMLTCNGKSM